MSALDKALLREDLSAPVTIATLTSLTPAQVALAAVRPDLDFLTRQRAYVEFLVRRSEYRKSSKRDSDEQPLFDHPLNFARLAPPSDLSVPDLLLLQFNPRCVSAHEVEAAQQSFFERARLQRAEDDAERQGLPVERCDLSYAGGVPSFAQGLSLQVEEGALVLSRAGKSMVKVESQHISSFQYVTTVDNHGTEGDMDCVLIVDATQAFFADDRPVSDAKLKIQLERVGSSSPCFGKLRSSVTMWSAVGAFSVDLVETRITRAQPAAVAPYPTPPARATSLPDASCSDSPTQSRSTTATSPVPSSIKRSSSDAPQQQPSNKRVCLVESSEREQCEGLWRFVSDTPEYASWHPGHIVRQIALLRAIMPTETLPMPHFSPDELALLSHATDNTALPDLPSRAPALQEWFKHCTFERLALERIYRDKPRLELDTTRLVLLTDSYPELRLYAQKVAKVRQARDDLQAAYATVVLDLERRIARLAASTQDPLDSLLFLVSNMRDSLTFCCQHFYHDGALIRAVPPSLTAVTIGTGPLRRFEAALKGIVLYEEMAGAIG